MAMDDGVHGQGRACTPKCLPSPERLRAGRRGLTWTHQATRSCLLFWLEIDLALPYTSVVSLKLLYNDNKGCHSRENGNPAEKTGFPRIRYGAGLIKSGMTFCVKSFLRQYTSAVVVRKGILIRQIVF